MIETNFQFKSAQILSLDGHSFKKIGDAKNHTQCDAMLGLHPYMGRIISVVGLRLGDEGKGRTVEELMHDITDYSGMQAPVGMMVKANGGANSGHTVYDEAGNKYAFNLIPAGVVNKTINYLALGSYVVADPLKIKWEGEPLERAGFNFWKRLIIDEHTMVADIGHRIRDLAREMTRENPVGSTGRGIAPAYGDLGEKDHIPYSAFLGSKEHFASLMRSRLTACCIRVKEEYQLSAIDWERIFDFQPDKNSPENPGLKQREELANHAAIKRGIFPKGEFDMTRFKGKHPFELNLDLIIEEYWQAGQLVRDNIKNVGDIAGTILNSTTQYIIAEHGQAIGLDVLHGDTPFTTSTITTSSIVPHTLRVPVTLPLHIVLVCKAYETSVGTHTLLTQIPEDHPLAQILLPQEKGATTGRQRWVSWPCAIQMGEALRLHGAHDFVLNKIDQLTLKDDWQGPLKICVGYRDPENQVHTRMPAVSDVKKTFDPLYLELPGWTEDISGIRSFEALPINAQRYIATLYAAMTQSANQGYTSPSMQQLPFVPMIGVGPKPGEVVRNVPLPEKLIAMAHDYVVRDGLVVLEETAKPEVENLQDFSLMSIQYLSDITT